MEMDETAEEKVEVGITPNRVLMNNIDKLQSVVIIGITHEGQLHVESNHPTFEYVGHLLDKAKFNLQVLEMNQENSMKKEVKE